MDGTRFDALIRALSVSRRTTFKTFSSGALAALLASRVGEQAEAGCKNVGKKCDKSKDCCDGAKCKGGKNGKCRCKSGLTDCAGDKACQDLTTATSHCGACGNACTAGDLCCSGVCANLATDSANCAACGQACGETETCVAGVCTTAEGCPVGADACTGERITCSGNFNCICSQSTEGETKCGDVSTPGAICGQCVTSADCASFGAGAFCVKSDSINCCGPSANNACRLPCPA